MKRIRGDLLSRFLAQDWDDWYRHSAPMDPPLSFIKTAAPSQAHKQNFPFRNSLLFFHSTLRTIARQTGENGTISFGLISLGSASHHRFQTGNSPSGVAGVSREQ
jgi:hypothetical protein